MKKPLFAIAWVACVACGAATTTSDGSSGSGAPAGPAGPRELPCDVDAVLAKSCRTCHSDPPVYGAPMPLVTHANLVAPARSDPAKKVYELVLERTGDAARPMPPPPNARLSDDGRATLGAWVAAGAPKSAEDCSVRPPGPVVPPVSCKPDLPLAPSAKWTMPKTTADEYVCYGVDVSRATPTHVTAFAPRIDNAKIVHHVVLFEADTSFPSTPRPCSSGGSFRWRMVMGWAPGGKGLELPKDVGFPIAETGSTHYVLQIHYSNRDAREGETDASGFDLCTEPPRKHEADVVAFGSHSFSIPPTNQPYTWDCSVAVPAQLGGRRAFAAMPHMHELGVAMSTRLERPAAAPVDLGTVDAWTFGSQPWLSVDAEIQAGDVIRTRCTWLNDTGKTVSFGESTGEEMCYSFTMYYPRIATSAWSWAAPAAATDGRCK